MMAVAEAADTGEGIKVSVATDMTRVTVTGGVSRVDFSPRILSSLIIFAHIYLTYYRTEDFTDLENFATTYIRFQTLLQRANHTTGHQIPLFDLENLDGLMDEISPNRRHF